MRQLIISVFATLGNVFTAIGIALTAVQIVIFLYTGEWMTPIDIVLEYGRPKNWVVAWIVDPKVWVGLHEILDSMLAGIAAVAVGFFSLMVAGIAAISQ